MNGHHARRASAGLPGFVGLLLVLVPSWSPQMNANLSQRQAPSPSTQAPVYAVHKVIVGQIIEYRFLCDDHHFMTLVDEDGTLNLRPHPGRDVNGWGSSWYAQPFLPGARLSHSLIDPPQVTLEGIRVTASGKVSRGASANYGTWQATLLVSYDGQAREIAGEGEYAIDLDGPLSQETGDLNLFKIASNYLDDVPLLTGGTGDTGDMQAAAVLGDEGLNFTWLPPQQPAHFPAETTSSLSIEVLGRYNLVDTQAMGYEPIKPAIKPSLKVVLESDQPASAITFGAIYDLAHRQHFWEDNVGITPLVRSPSTHTAFRFDVQFAARADEYYLYAPLIFRTSSSQPSRHMVHQRSRD